MDEKQENKNPQSTNKVSTVSPLTDAPVQQSEQSPKSKLPFSALLRRGGNQYNAMPAEQKFTPPPASAIVENATLPTQPVVQQNVVPEEKDHFPLKITFLIVGLFILALAAVAATLHYTEYFIYQPPAPIKNLIENFFANMPKISFPIGLPKFGKN